MAINWFPGHMKKTKDMILSNLKLVDVCVELLDSRIPISSKNPIFDDLMKNKIRIFALNKIDLADDNMTLKYEKYLKEKSPVVSIEALNSNGIDKLCSYIKKEFELKNPIKKEEFQKDRPIRVMIVGIPNVGKSTLINTLSRKKATAVGNKAGITKGKQWVKLRDDMYLFDTPGILYPKIEEDIVGYKLAISGSIRDEILNMEEIALEFIKLILPKYGYLLERRYAININNILKNHKNFEYMLKEYSLLDIENKNIENDLALNILHNIAINRKLILSKNEVDYERASRLIIDEFRKGIIGKITLD